MSQQEYIVLTVGHLNCAVSVASVREIQGPLGLTPIPKVHPAIAGLVNLRGQVLTCIDLRTRLGLNKPEVGAECVNVIAFAGSRTMSLLADDAKDEITLSDSQLHAPPETLPAALNTFIPKVSAQPVGILLVLDVNRIMDLQLRTA